MQDLKADSTRSNSSASSKNSVVARTVILSAVILTGLYIIAFFLEDNLAKWFGKYAVEVVTGLMLLALWLVVSSAIRSINSLAKGIETWKLLAAGLMTAFVSAILYAAFLLIFPRVSKSPNAIELAGASGGMILLLTGIGFIVSLIALINTRVRNRSLGNLLELLVIGGAIFGFIYFVNKG
jgi:hypothetical protein